MREKHILKILQNNVRKSGNRIQVPLLSDPRVREFTVVAIQEPWRNANTKQSLSNSGDGFHIIYPQEPNARVCLYINKDIDPTTWEVVANERDLQTIRIWLYSQREEENMNGGWGTLAHRGESAQETQVTATPTPGPTQGTRATSISIHNVYNPSPISISSTDSPTTLYRLRKALDAPGEHLILGDFNLHHPYWGGTRCLDRHAMADELIGISVVEGLSLLLPEGTITREQNTQRTTIDLVWATERLAEHLRRCGVRPDLHQGSDHLPIATELDLEVTDNREKKPRKSWKQLNQEKLQEKLRIYMPYTRSMRNTDEIDTFAETLISAIQRAAEEATPNARITKYSKPFWTLDCSEAVRQARSKRTAWKTQPTDERWEEYTKATDHKGKIIAKAKRAHWRAITHAASDSKLLWKLSKWATQRSRLRKEPPQFPPLKRQLEAGNPQTLATEFNEKAEILARKFFPEPRIAELEDLGTTEYPEKLESNRIIDITDVKTAIRRPKADKAPGPSGIPNRILQAGIEEIAPAATLLFNACMEQGYHPKIFKKATTIVLKKPNKEDYTEPKAYRPIALLDTLGKVLETIMAKKLSDLAEEHSLLPTTQYGARRSKNTETALEHLVELTHTAWGCNGAYVATILSLDVEGAFDNVNSKRLLHNLEAKGIPEYIIRWVSSFIEDRSTTLLFGGKMTATRKIHAGIPQGSPISPILFLFFNGPLLEKIERLGLKATAIGFVDDVNLLAYGRSTRDTCDTLTKAHRECEAWAKTHGATFAPQKYELIHLTRQPRRHDMAASITIQGNAVTPQADIRILGMRIDSKLRWGPHLTQIEKKHAKQMLALSTLGASTWGATFARARQVYSAVIRSSIAYGAPIWHRRTAGGKLAAKEKRIETLQNQGLRHISGAYKKTSTETLEAETYIQPIGIHLDLLQDRATLRRRIAGHAQTTRKACDRIYAKIGSRQRHRRTTPGDRKLRLLNKTIEEGMKILYGIRATRWSAEEWTDANTPKEQEKAIRAYHANQWEIRWERYRRSKEEAIWTPAQSARLTRAKIRMRKGLAKAESTMATHIRTERIGLNAYLQSRRVPGHDSASCQCGHPRQTAKHVIMFCRRYIDQRRGMLEAADTQDYRKLVTQPKGLKEVTKFLIQTGLLAQFSLANRLLYGEE